MAVIVFISIFSFILFHFMTLFTDNDNTQQQYFVLKDLRGTTINR